MVTHAANLESENARKLKSFSQKQRSRYFKAKAKARERAILVSASYERAKIRETGYHVKPVIRRGLAKSIAKEREDLLRRVDLLNTDSWMDTTTKNVINVSVHLRLRKRSKDKNEK